jgi:hypothetical protein
MVVLIGKYKTLIKTEVYKQAKKPIALEKP